MGEKFMMLELVKSDTLTEWNFLRVATMRHACYLQMCQQHIFNYVQYVYTYACDYNATYILLLTEYMYTDYYVTLM